MIQFRNEKIQLTILIEGYAYPFSREYWDANWLSVGVCIMNDSEEIYRNNDPCLLTTELVDLRKWFQNIIKKSQRAFFIDFMEPCLSFKFEEGALYISLKYNLNPSYTQDFDSVYTASFKLKEKEIERIIYLLDKYIEKYPEKIYPR